LIFYYLVQIEPITDKFIPKVSGMNMVRDKIIIYIYNNIYIYIIIYIYKFETIIPRNNVVYIY
jgi:hypothetical protein